MSAKREFVLYENLVFFWKKKKYFLIVPLILSLIAIGLSMFQDRPYEAKTLFYVGGLTEDRLTDNDLILKIYEEKLPEEYRDDFKVIIPSDGRVKFQVTSSDKNVAEKQLEKVSNQYWDDLESAYNKRKELTQEGKTVFKTQSEKTEERIDFYTEKLKNENLSIVEIDNYKEILLELETNLPFFIENMRKQETNLHFFEEPMEIETVIKQEESNLIPNLLIAIFGGLFLTVLGLVFWKYIIDARRGTQRD
ncbi:hypothetical protein ACTWQL_03645 [Pseudalkalibacillus sp. R45]|uniref:hypothetical protein n=1 Tax=Pseudalkalibacillus sp. R45 TaxID=3457433 RepID=UPI003FCE0FFB